VNNQSKKLHDIVDQYRHILTLHLLPEKAYYLPMKNDAERPGVVDLTMMMTTTMMAHPYC
jgi:hypothetical protein